MRRGGGVLPCRPGWVLGCATAKESSRSSHSTGRFFDGHWQGNPDGLSSPEDPKRLLFDFGRLPLQAAETEGEKPDRSHAAKTGQIICS